MAGIELSRALRKYGLLFPRGTVPEVCGHEYLFKNYSTTTNRSICCVGNNNWH
jgi:hypothetical protein